VALSRRKQGFDSPWEYHLNPIELKPARRLHCGLVSGFRMSQSHPLERLSASLCLPADHSRNHMPEKHKSRGRAAAF
ncbi:MAG: hypothetical protein ABW191_10245, partial [Aliihoeflea sp.]